jgi:hypothetical protein
VPVDQSSLCNIDHFPNFRTQDDLAGAFGSGAELALRRAAIADDPATTGALNVAGRRQARKAASLPRGARAGDFAFKS